jgi:hypothetical protein
MPKEDPVADAADALNEIARALHRIGIGNASAEGWGAIEAHSQTVKDAGERIGEALEGVASAIRELAEATAKRG